MDSDKNIFTQRGTFTKHFHILMTPQHLEVRIDERGMGFESTQIRLCLFGCLYLLSVTSPVFASVLFFFFFFKWTTTGRKDKYRKEEGENILFKTWGCSGNLKYLDLVPVLWKHPMRYKQQIVDKIIGSLWFSRVMRIFIGTEHHCALYGWQVNLNRCLLQVILLNTSLFSLIVTHFLAAFTGFWWALDDSIKVTK